MSGTGYPHFNRPGLSDSTESRRGDSHQHRETTESVDLRLANERLQAEITERKKIEKEVTRLNREVEDTQREVICKLANIVEARSRETASHVMRVAELSYLLADMYGLEKSQADLIRLAAPMHDIGKVGVPDSILQNPGRLSTEEFEIMKTHTTSGYDMLKDSNRAILKTAAVIAHQHHEKFNGTGYPQGLTGERIHIFGRITGIADVFDALSSDRIYRKAWEMGRIEEYFEKQRGESFDPKLIDLFIENFKKFVVVKNSFPSEVCNDDEDIDNASGKTEEDWRKMILQAGSNSSDFQMFQASVPDRKTTARIITSTSIPQESGQGEQIIRVLVADDDRKSVNLLEKTLARRGYDIVTADTGKRTLKEMRKKNPPNLAIVNYAMCEKDGINICQKIRQLKGEYIYITVIGQKGNDTYITDGMAAGADAYIRKPFDEEDIDTRLQAAERILKLQSRLIATQDSLREQATHDNLSNLWNRGAIMKILSSELDRAKREDTSVGLIMGDLDKFKSINDTHGHQAGDIVLRESAQQMRNMMRPYDMVGRYGGEEFLMIVPRCDSTFASYVAERIRSAIASQPIRIGNQDINVTISLGVAAMRGIEDRDSEALIQAADQALYQAKNNGRNQVVIADLQALAVG